MMPDYLLYPLFYSSPLFISSSKIGLMSFEDTKAVTLPTPRIQNIVSATKTVGTNRKMIQGTT